MQSTYILAALTLLAGNAEAAHRVVVYVRQDNFVIASLGRAQETAKRVLFAAGVTAAFRSGSEHKKARRGEITLELSLDGRVPDQFHPGAFGFAAPYGTSGTRIHVFGERIQRMTPDAGTGIILGYVLAHEIGHVLQGVGQHSNAGVMKARWDVDDYRKMKASGLPWEERDADLIQQALAGRTSVVASTMQSPANPPATVTTRTLE